jgi:D-alanyl-D-alanine endopeptidase (penicillin-binding protein 7)
MRGVSAVAKQTMTGQAGTATAATRWSDRNAGLPRWLRNGSSALALTLALSLGLQPMSEASAAERRGTTPATQSAAAKAAPARAQGQRQQAAPQRQAQQRTAQQRQAQQRRAQQRQAQQRQAQKRQAQQRQVAQRRPSVGELTGLRATADELDLKSSVAFVVDQDTDEVLFEKNAEAVLPIASITKLMTALVITEAGLPLNERLLVTPEVARVRAGNPRLTLPAGARLTRESALHLALMSSENRAAHLLGLTYPGGMGAFVQAMNAKARELGMNDTRYVEPTGLSDQNRSSARDLAMLVRAAYEHPVIREMSTATQAVMPVGKRQVQFRTTNGLVHNPEWNIGLQKTGYIAAAGRCVALQAELAGRKVIMVLLDSAGRYARIGDAERLRQMVAENQLLRDLGFHPR